MNCRFCKYIMHPVRTARPEELIEVDVLDFVGCSEVVLWCCENCGQTLINCPGK